MPYCCAVPVYLKLNFQRHNQIICCFSNNQSRSDLIKIQDLFFDFLKEKLLFGLMRNHSVRKTLNCDSIKRNLIEIKMRNATSNSEKMFMACVNLGFRFNAFFLHLQVLYKIFSALVSYNL